MDFTILSTALYARFQELGKYPLFRVDVDGDEIYELYLSSFPEGTNPIHIERTQHDCSCCKHFIRTMGNVVAIIEGTPVSIWETAINDPTYQTVVDTLARRVRGAKITGPFLHNMRRVGTEATHQLLEDNSLREWNHFHVDIPNRCHRSASDIPTMIGNMKTAFATSTRAYTEITPEAVSTTLELIHQGSLYRGEEYRERVTLFQHYQAAWFDLDTQDERDIALWESLSTYEHIVWI